MPAVVARRAGLRDRLGAPHLGAGLGVERDDEASAAGARIGTAGNAGNDFAVRGERPARERVALLVVRHGGVPDHLAGVRVERHQMSVGRGEALVVVQRDGAACAIKQVVVIAAFDLRQLAPILPQQIAAAAVERLHDVLGVGEEQHAVVRQRRLFLVAELHVPGPGEFQTADILSVDLIERAIAQPAKLPRRISQSSVAGLLSSLSEIGLSACKRSSPALAGSSPANNAKAPKAQISAGRVAAPRRCAQKLSSAT